MRHGILATLGVAIALFVIAGCGGSSDSSTSAGGGGGSAYDGTSTSDTGSTAASGGSSDVAGDGIVKTDDNADLGEIIVDSQGFTLYDFHKDKGTESACYDACAEVWPPLLTKGDPQGQGATMRSLLGTTQRTDGTTQVTYNGHPVYAYQGDSQPGETNGNDFSQFGAQWYALTAAGEEPAD